MDNEPVQYVISLKRPNYRFVNIISQLLLVLFLVSFGYYLLKSGLYTNAWLYLVPTFIIGLWIYGYVRSADPSFLMYYRVELMIAAIGWMSMVMIPYAKYIGVAYAVMSVIERFVKAPNEYVFSAENVIRRGFPLKTIDWVSIDNVIIRDNLFTLDLSNNKIIQMPLDEPVSKELEQEFNQWCKQQLHFQDIPKG